MLSFTTSIIFAYVRENKRLVVTRSKEGASLLGIDSFTELSILNKNEWSKKLETICATDYKYKSKILINSFDNKSPEINEIANYMNKAVKEEKYNITNNIYQYLKLNKVLLIITLKETKKESLLDFKKIISDLNLEVTNLIIISNKND